MLPTSERTRFRFNRIAPSIVAVAAIAGWGVGGYSILKTSQLEKRFEGDTAALQSYQAQFLMQRKTIEDKEREVAHLHEQLAASRAEIERHSTKLKDTEEELTKAREQLASVQPLLQPHVVGSAPALMRITPLPTKQDVIAAQEALTQLRFGDLKADGVIGSSTREAIEKFQQTVGLPVTGQLHSQTLSALMRSAKVMAAQGEQTRDPL